MSSQSNGQAKSIAAFLRLLADEIEGHRVVSFEGVSWYGDTAVQGIYNTTMHKVPFRCDTDRDTGVVAASHG